MQENENNHTPAFIIGSAILLGSGTVLMILLFVALIIAGAVTSSTTVLTPSTVISTPIPTIIPVLSLDTPPNGANYALVPIATGFDNPILITHSGDGSGRLFVAEQTGMVWILENGVEQPTPFIDISLLLSTDVFRGTYSERGLLGLAFHPDYANNGVIAIHYTDVRGDTRIARYHVNPNNPNQALPNSGEILLEIPQPHHDHNGGMIAFGPDGYLYIGIGDGGAADDPDNNAQNLGLLLGKILRIDIMNENIIPPTNPFVDIEGASPEIWAYGLRNPWRFSFDRATGDLYIGDVGQWMMEEIDFQPANSLGGENYGWRDYEGTLLRAPAPPENTDSMIMPITEFAHTQGCSITGGYVYRGLAMPELNGVYIYADYCSGRVWTLHRNSSDEWINTLFMETGRQITSFGEDEHGELYLADYKGDILQLVENHS